jgi:hypothetical protein
MSDPIEALILDPLEALAFMTPAPGYGGHHEAGPERCPINAENSGSRVLCGKQAARAQL